MTRACQAIDPVPRSDASGSWRCKTQISPTMGIKIKSAYVGSCATDHLQKLNNNESCAENQVNEKTPDSPRWRRAQNTWLLSRA